MDIIELSLERRVQNGEKLLGFTRSLEQRRVELCDQRTESKNGSPPHGCARFKGSDSIRQEYHKMRHKPGVNGVYHVQVTVWDGADGWIVRRVPSSDRGR